MQTQLEQQLDRRSRGSCSTTASPVCGRSDLIPPEGEELGEQLYISPGDLDEAVSTALVIGDAGLDSDQMGSAFEKIDFFRAGVLGGLDECNARIAGERLTSRSRPRACHDRRDELDEFGLFHENIAEYGLAVPERPRATPAWTPRSSPATAIPGASPRWCGATRTRELVFLHGGAQNAHTWDTVALALGVPLVAVDLPGHGHSGWRADGAYTPANLADDVAIAVRQPGALGASAVDRHVARRRSRASS